MTVFITSLIVLIATVASFIISLAIWAYTDAKFYEKTSPVLWVIIIIFGCFPIGLIIYILARGANSQSHISNKYSKMLIVTFVLIFPALFFIFVGSFHLNWASQEEGFFRRPGYFHTLRHDVGEQEWVLSAVRANGMAYRNFYLTQYDLDNLYTFLRIYEGEVILRLRQINYDVSESFIISDELITTIDVTRIEPGMIRKYVIFSEASNIDLTINWAENNHRERE